MPSLIRPATAVAILSFAVCASAQASTVATIQSSVDQLQFKVYALPGSTSPQPSLSLTPAFVNSEGTLVAPASGGFEVNYLNGNIYDMPSVHTEAWSVNANVLPLDTTTFVLTQ